MRILHYTELRQNLASVLNGIEDDAEPVAITRSGHEPIVMITQREYDSLLETLHVIGDRANARELFDALDDADAERNMREVSMEEIKQTTHGATAARDAVS